MNHRNAIPAKGTSWRLSRIRSRRAASVVQGLVARVGQRHPRHRHGRQEQDPEDDPGDRGGTPGAPEGGASGPDGSCSQVRPPLQESAHHVVTGSRGLPPAEVSVHPARVRRALTADASLADERGVAVTEAGFAILMLLVLGWAVFSNLLTGVNITGALAFLVAGYLLGNPSWGPVTVDVDAPSVHLLAEVTLALLLFADASRVNVAQLRQDVAVPARLLGLGLPVSIILGSLTAALLFDDMSWARCRVRRRHPGSDGRGAQCPGDQRRADPDAVAPRAERGERAERRHRHPHRRVHARGRRDRPRSGRSRPRRGRGRPARARVGRRRRPGGRPRQRRGHRVRLETAMDRARRSAAGHPGRRPHQLRARDRPRRQRVHRRVRRGHRLRRRAAEGRST